MRREWVKQAKVAALMMSELAQYLTCSELMIRWKIRSLAFLSHYCYNKQVSINLSSAYDLNIWDSLSSAVSGSRIANNNNNRFSICDIVFQLSFYVWRKPTYMIVVSSFWFLMVSSKHPVVKATGLSGKRGIYFAFQHASTAALDHPGDERIWQM